MQIAHQLRFTRRTPPRADRLSARPREGSRERGWGRFLDNPDALHGDEPGPTLVTFDNDDAVDVVALLRQGAIREPMPGQLPPANEPPADAEGDSDG